MTGTAGTRRCRRELARRWGSQPHRATVSTPGPRVNQRSQPLSGIHICAGFDPILSGFAGCSVFLHEFARGSRRLEFGSSPNSAHPRGFYGDWPQTDALLPTRRSATLAGIPPTNSEVAERRRNDGLAGHVDSGKNPRFSGDFQLIAFAPFLGSGDQPTVNGPPTWLQLGGTIGRSECVSIETRRSHLGSCRALRDVRRTVDRNPFSTEPSSAAGGREQARRLDSAHCKLPLSQSISVRCFSSFFSSSRARPEGTDLSGVISALYDQGSCAAPD